MAVHAASEYLSSGSGVVLLIYATEVVFPELISIYPVGIISSLVFLIMGAAITCWPISNSGFLPEIKERKRSASAVGSICIELPGNNTTGIVTFSFICLTTSERFVVVIRLPPTKKKSTQSSLARLI